MEGRRGGENEGREGRRGMIWKLNQVSHHHCFYLTRILMDQASPMAPDSPHHHHLKHFGGPV